MDDAVIRAIARWPDVPHVFGWLSLDRRGDWRVKGSRITHPGAVAFVNRNYEHDEAGRWFFQNGPQRVFVSLDYTPWVYRVAVHGPELQVGAHTGISADPVRQAFIDEAGAVLLLTGLGIGVVSDRDLAAVLSRLEGGSGELPDDNALEHALDALRRVAGPDPGLHLRLSGRRVALGHLPSGEVAGRFGFVAQPVPPPGQAECYDL